MRAGAMCLAQCLAHDEKAFSKLGNKQDRKAGKVKERQLSVLSVPEQETMHSWFAGQFEIVQPMAQGWVCEHFEMKEIKEIVKESLPGSPAGVLASAGESEI